MVLFVVGVMFIFVMKGVDVELVSLKGFLLILLFVLFFVMYNIVVRKMIQWFKLIEFIYIMLVIGFVVFNVIVFICYGVVGIVSIYFQLFWEFGFVFVIVYLGVLFLFVILFLFNYMLLWIEVFKMSVFNYVFIIVMMIVGVVILNESLLWYYFVGVVCIMIGVLGSNINLQKKINYYRVFVKK